MKTSMMYLWCAANMMFVFPACEKNSATEQKAPPAAQVSIYQVQQKSVSYYDQYPATVVALDQVEIRPEVSGNIVSIDFRDGQHVQKGARLYVIDQQQYRAAYEQAVANLNVARANEVRAQQDAERYRDLAKRDAVARQSLEHAEADLASAKMQTAAADANVNAVQTNLKRSVISAPFDGTIGISQVRVGSAVSAGATLLNTISTDNPVGVDFSIDEKLLPYFTKLLNEKPDPKDSTFSLILPDRSVYPQHGHLRLFDRAVDPQTGTIRGRLEFPNPQRMLKDGLTVNVRVKNESPDASTLIPYRAVTEQMGEYSVFVVHNKDRVRQQRITLGTSLGEMIIVRSGLTQGDTIVTEGMQRLRDNSLIAVTSPQKH